MARDCNGFFVGFLLGGIIGAGLALLLAPKSGEETREFLRDKGLEIKEKVPEVIKEGIEKSKAVIMEGLEKGKTAVSEGLAKTKALLEEKKTELKEQ
jgi:gas vesicle protein